MSAELEAGIARALPSALKMGVYSAKKQNFEVLKYAIEGVDSLCNSAGFLRDFEDQEHLAMLDETAREFAVLETQISRYKKQLEKMEALIESGKMDPSKIDKMIQDSVAKPRMNVTQHEIYKKFAEKAGIEVEADADEDVVFQESESTRNLTCPVTQLQMENPLRNPICGHTYSEQGIRSHLQRSKTCPVAGCPQKLSFNNLERDVEMEVLIARQKSATQQQRSQANASFAPQDSDAEEEEEYVVD